jgi:hypothetical protein
LRVNQHFRFIGFNNGFHSDAESYFQPFPDSQRFPDSQPLPDPQPIPDPDSDTNSESDIYSCASSYFRVLV